MVDAAFESFHHPKSAVPKSQGRKNNGLLCPFASWCEQKKAKRLPHAKARSRKEFKRR